LRSGSAAALLMLRRIARKWGQLLAFLALTVVAVSAETAYSVHQSRETRREVQNVVRELAHPAPGANVTVAYTRHPDGTVTITQTIVRAVTIPGRPN
jgi:uncharacterized membrane protein YebE (DUF533 family)